MDYKYVMPAIGSVVAAIIASVIAFIVAVLSKESKISEFRRDWIESLRQECADYLSNVMIMMAAIKYAEIRELNVPEYLISKSEQVTKLHALHFSIVLRLRDGEHKSLIELFDKLDDSASEGYDACKVIVAEIRRELPILLNEEWGRVKDGEPLYKTLKKIAVIILFSGVTLLAGIIGAVVFYH